MNFRIYGTGKSDKQIAEEVVSRYLDQSVFPSSCPAGWILNYKITDFRQGYPIDQMVWVVTYEISPFPGSDYNGFPSIYSLPNGNLGEYRIFTLKSEGNVYSIINIASGG